MKFKVKPYIFLLIFTPAFLTVGKANAFPFRPPLKLISPNPNLTHSNFTQCDLYLSVPMRNLRAKETGTEICSGLSEYFPNITTEQIRMTLGNLAKNLSGLSPLRTAGRR